MIHEAARRNGLRPEFVQSVAAVESNFQTAAISPKGAIGLMQLMPGTAAALGADPNDPAQNADAGARYLRQLLMRYKDSPDPVRLALAAYNAGSDAVDRHGKAIPPYQETRDYVKKVSRLTDVQRASLKQRIIYKTFEIVDGRAIPRYSSRKPDTGSYEIVVQ